MDNKNKRDPIHDLLQKNLGAMKDSADQRAPSADLFRQSLLAKLEQSSGNPGSESKHGPVQKLRYWMAVAASILILPLPFLFYFQETITVKTEIPREQSRNFLLQKEGSVADESEDLDLAANGMAPSGSRPAPPSKPAAAPKPPTPEPIPGSGSQPEAPAPVASTSGMRIADQEALSLGEADLYSESAPPEDQQTYAIVEEREESPAPIRSMGRQKESAKKMAPLRERDEKKILEELERTTDLLKRKELLEELLTIYKTNNNTIKIKETEKELRTLEEKIQTQTKKSANGDN